VKEQLHKIEVWASRHGAATAVWPDHPVDPFFNVNTPEDAARANEVARQYEAEKI
jgi:molybdopterin-guanine dinucleotide biosynthesis protein A